MTARIFELVHQINGLEKQIRGLSDEKKVLEEELKYLAVDDEGVRDVRRKADK